MGISIMRLIAQPIFEATWKGISIIIPPKIIHHRRHLIIDPLGIITAPISSAPLFFNLLQPACGLNYCRQSQGFDRKSQNHWHMMCAWLEPPHLLTCKAEGRLKERQVKPLAHNSQLRDSQIKVRNSHSRPLLLLIELRCLSSSPSFSQQRLSAPILKVHSNPNPEFFSSRDPQYHHLRLRNSSDYLDRSTMDGEAKIPNLSLPQCPDTFSLPPFSLPVYRSWILCSIHSLPPLASKKTSVKQLTEATPRDTPRLKFEKAVSTKLPSSWEQRHAREKMDQLIQHPLWNVNIIRRNRLDLSYFIGHNGEVVILQVWKLLVSPDWAITMCMWPTSGTPYSTKQGFLHIHVSGPHSRSDLVIPNGEITIPHVLELLVWDVCSMLGIPHPLTLKRPFPRPLLSSMGFSSPPPLKGSRQRKRKPLFKRKKRGEISRFLKWAGNISRSSSMRFTKSDTSLIPHISSIFSLFQTSGRSYLAERPYKYSSALSTYDLIKLESSSNFDEVPNSRMLDNKVGDSSPLIYYATNSHSASGSLAPKYDDEESSEEESLSRLSSISSFPSGDDSSQSSISQNSRREYPSSHSSSNFSFSSQDSSSLVSSDAGEESSGEFLADSLSSSKSRFIDKLMKEFHVILYSSPDLRTCTGTQSGSNDSATAAIPQSTLQPNESGAGKGSSTEHRKGWQKDEDGGDQDDGDSQRRRNKTNNVPDAEPAPIVRFACPFFKHSPRFKGVHRMKEHLYRCHVSIYCRRCHKIFQTEDELENHQRLPQPCMVSSNSSPQGLSVTQIARLKSKKRFGSEKTEEERWRAVYHFLFPSVPVMSVSPYCDDLVEPLEGSELDDFEIFSRREFPRRVRQRLESLCERLEIEEALREELAQIASQCREEIFSEFQQQQNELPAPPVGRARYRCRPAGPKMNLQPLDDGDADSHLRPCKRRSETLDCSIIQAPQNMCVDELPNGPPLGYSAASFPIPSPTFNMRYPAGRQTQRPHRATLFSDLSHLSAISSSRTVENRNSNLPLDELLNLLPTTDSFTWENQELAPLNDPTFRFNDTIDQPNMSPSDTSDVRLGFSSGPMDPNPEMLTESDYIMQGEDALGRPIIHVELMLASYRDRIVYTPCRIYVINLFLNGMLRLPPFPVISHWRIFSIFFIHLAADLLLCLHSLSNEYSLIPLTQEIIISSEKLGLLVDIHVWNGFVVVRQRKDELTRSTRLTPDSNPGLKNGEFR
ncbi:uncharacterized protein BDR25DRAFT_357082 [Lindgomyces ingoldianus]|uniref:Uncharacterized protein n=1 Tax=Lindgomyces ingoldianus TaxID=673940 RepID=A0ACB6QP73_9PLEO|nr:uncharacterized protein BDR25DRAFT_357082 [Lindgomyces ingoldianus]KAF2468716.1 hypothetical protein BDR25DRAFT_357082 [Lindgomyces ingoldianus]